MMPNNNRNIIATRKLNKKWLMLSDEEREAATRAIPCPFCKQPVGWECRTAAGNKTIDHSPRIVLAAKAYE